MLKKSLALEILELLGIRESTDLTFNLYKYARNVGAKKRSTKPDLLELLKNTIAAIKKYT